MHGHNLVKTIMVKNKIDAIQIIILTQLIRCFLGAVGRENLEVIGTYCELSTLFLVPILNLYAMVIILLKEFDFSIIRIIKILIYYHIVFTLGCKNSIYILIICF